jgi:hypothetical protein
MNTVESNDTERHAQPVCPIRCQDRYRKLCDDEPGCHTYVWACVCCQREFGPEWEEYHATWMLTD